MKLKNWLKSFKLSKRKTSLSIKSVGNTTSKNQNLEFQKERQKYYKSIYDCPIRNYFKVLETGDSRYLYVDWNKLPEKRLDKEFDEIFWQYQEESGLDDKLKMSLNYKAKIIDLELQELTTGKKLKPRIAYYESLLNGLKGKNKKQSLSKRLAILSKYMGYSISPNTTLFDYIGIEKLYIEDAKSTVNR